MTKGTAILFTFDEELTPDQISAVKKAVDKVGVNGDKQGAGVPSPIHAHSQTVVLAWGSPVIYQP